MLIRLANVAVHLQSDSELIRAAWQKIFANAPQDIDVVKPATQLSLELQLVRALSPPPAAECIYHDPQGIVDAYRQGATSAITLHFRHGALVRLSPEGPREARGEVTMDIFRHGHLEDVTFTALAPLLRRLSCYLLHAAAVTTPAGAVLLVGPSHSGKTTTGLALVLAGWKHLASDVVVLSHSKTGIVAHPTAGVLSARTRSFELLPKLHELLQERRRTGPDVEQEHLTIAPKQWSSAMPVTTICFPQVTGESPSSLQRLEGGLALAQLMQESVDRWDADALLQHIEFLTTLSRQVRHYRLALGPDVERLPQLLQATL